MKKVVVGSVLIVMCVLGMMGLVTLAVRSAFAPRPWPDKLGMLDEAPSHFPDVETSAAAQVLIQLTPPLGFSIRPKTADLREPEVSGDFEKVKEPLKQYCRSELNRTNEAIISPPPQVASYLDTHRGDIDRVRDHILNAGPIVWVSHFKSSDSALPNLTGHFNLTRVLSARALLKASLNDATAWDDLHAAWLADRELWFRPEEISQAVALADVRMVNASASKMPLPAPGWLNEMRTFDYRHHLVAAFQAEAFRLKRSGGGMPFPPLFCGVATNRAAENARVRTAELVMTSNCDLSAVPDMKFSWTNIIDVNPRAQRFHRFVAELETTEKAIAIRSGDRPSTTSQCADGSWAVTPSSAVFNRQILLPIKDNYPLAYRR